jgi:hypothetical protein
MSGKFKKWAFMAATLFSLIAAASVLGKKEKTMAQDEAIDRYVDNRVPDEAVYLGTDMGGEFVVLRRQDVRLETGKVMPAFHLEIYRAWSGGDAYGVNRIGRLIYSGLGLYVPPQSLVDEIGKEAFEPPSIDHIFSNDGDIFNGWVNSDIFWVRAKPYSQDPEAKFIGKIIPLNLDLQQSREMD